MQIKKEHLPLDVQELQRHKDKIDKQIAEAQERRLFNHCICTKSGELQMEDFSRFERPVVSRNIPKPASKK